MTTPQINEQILEIIRRKGCATVKEIASELNYAYTTVLTILNDMAQHSVVKYDFGRLVLFCSPGVDARTASFEALNRIGIRPDWVVRELCARLAATRTRVASIRPSRFVRDVIGVELPYSKYPVLANAFIYMLGDAVSTSRDGFGRLKYAIDVEKAWDVLQCRGRRKAKYSRVVVQVPAKLVAEAERRAAERGRPMPDAVHEAVERLYELFKDGDYGGATKLRIYVYQDTKALIDALTRNGVFRNRSELMRLVLAMIAHNVKI